MLTSERKALILDLLRRDGRVVAKTVSQDFGVSEDTIRRDLRDMAADGLLQRVHGGALPVSPAMADMSERWRVAPDSKDAVARAAAMLVRPGQVVFLDGGTTTVRMARHLPAGLRATVVTHSPSVAVELAAHATVEVELLGGRLFKHSVVTVGAAALEGIARIRADAFFMGVTGLHPEAGLTTGDAEEAAIKRALSRQSAETFVLASREKLGAVSPFLVLPLREIDMVIVEPDLPAALLAPFREVGTTIVS